MKELIGRLEQVDPDSSAILKVIAYFDGLVEARASLDAFVRGAASLSRCNAGVIVPHTLTLRFAPSGQRLPDRGDVADTWPCKVLSHGSESAVWLEKPGECSPADLMVLERLASGARIALERTRGELLDDHALVALLLDPTVVEDVRDRAAHRLRIAGRLRFRAVCSEPGGTVPATSTALHHSTALETSLGFLQATIEATPHSVDSTPAIGSRKGVGPWGALSNLPQSWECAVTAWQLTTESTPVLVYEELGVISELARIPADEDSPADLRRIASLVQSHSWALPTLDALMEKDTVRAASALLGVHHSTVQARVGAINSALGYVVTSPRGRLRLGIALILYRLSVGRSRRDGSIVDQLGRVRATAPTISAEMPSRKSAKEQR